MAQEHQFLAVDFGAESGRGILVTLRDDRVEMEQIHRWANRPVRMGGTLYWDLPFLYAEMLAAMRICAERGVTPAGMSVDTWGVDFGLLGRDGKLLSMPVHYRDERTGGIHEYSDPTMSREEIFAATGYEPWAISSLFQLLSMQRDGSGLLGMTETFLNMPDLFNYFLTGRRANELSIVNTSNLLGTDCRWSRTVIDRFGLGDMFGELVAPATVLGELQGTVAEATGLGALPVIATCGHDTSAALAAVPAEGEDWAFLSCGTWSILGRLVPKPLAVPRCLELGFANEYTLEGWYLAGNILGLWLIQELRRKWDTSTDPWDYVRMTAEARKDESAAYDGLLNVADESLLAPADMEEAVQAILAGAAQKQPETRGRLIRCILESLALEYAARLKTVDELTARRSDRLYMVGGGIANTLLCQFTANACGIAVHAGADQCTALGNALTQAVALGILSDGGAIRRVMRNSTEIITYQPQDQSLWGRKRQAYEALQKNA